MSWTMCTSGAAIAKAGANANSDVKASGAVMDRWSDEAEATVNVLTRKDYVADYPSSANVQGILADVTSSIIAGNIISYDMGGFTSRAEAETMLDFLRDSYTRGLSLLRDKKQTKFIDGA